MLRALEGSAQLLCRYKWAPVAVPGWDRACHRFAASVNVLDRSHLSSTAGCGQESAAIDAVAEKRAKSQKEQRGRVRRGSSSNPSKHMYHIVGRRSLQRLLKSPTWLPRFPMLQPYL
ncbi:hypothetical protein PYCCODRAFT_585608 [Trametes coccinea BRFM310]|uniref:Uncharacterized protein n=1 Tax=Trametes coccinea (strain BRFM310) TaxID=1353009 RepID=A0A1Y2J1G4_TRAC3|nr:hypothetical protein PYCCODRAFT_585608 [Trametes coccinea BRFM310]